MSILEKLTVLSQNNEDLIITPAEYQVLCKEVFDLGEQASDYDDLILNYTFQSKEVIVKDIE